MKTSEQTNSSTPSAGQIVGGGHFSLHVPLGCSGLLWLAQDEELQRLAVVRFFPPELRQDARAFEKLKTRVEAAIPVTHENVCRTWEWYDSAGVESFVAAEYVEGKPFTQSLHVTAGRGVPWETLKPAAASVACGLEALHRAGVVHHGVAPENIFLAVDKRVKLLNAVVTGTLRNPLFVPGALRQPQNLRCFSPQQLAGEDPTTADDFYSLGATLYELLTGAPVFGATSALLQDIRSKPASSLSEILDATYPGHDVPESVLAFIMACLSKDAAQRPTSFGCLLPRRREEAVPVGAAAATKPEEKIIPLPTPVQPAELLAQVPMRTELELVRHARDARPGRSRWAMAAGLVLLLGLGGAWGFIQIQKQQQVERRLASLAQQEARQRQLAEQSAQQAAARLEQEVAARKESEENARLAREAARKAEASQRAEAQARQEREQLAAAQKPASPAPKPWAPPPVPDVTTNGFITLFNGHDLADWVGETNFWSVRDGFITAQARSDEAKERHLLTWQKGNVGDFEMHFSYRFRVMRGNKSPNGGVNYRLSGTTNFSCYQFDLVTNAKDNGSVSDDRRRSRLAGFGDAVTATSSNKHPVITTLGDTNKLSAIKPEDWNRCVIIARGDRLTHYINGELVADVTDASKSKRHMAGAIALELYTRNTNNCATFLQFNDLKLKRLGPEPKGQGTGLASTSR